MRVLNERESLVKAMKMVPVECVVRNVCAGSMAKRYGIEEGRRLPEPIFEFFLKSDALHDPLCNDDHIRVLGWASADEIAQMRKLTHKVNAVLKPLFADAGIDLVDYKLEFGHPTDDPAGALVLGDEFTPDGCRLWDAKTRREARQGPLPPRSRRGDRALPRSGAANRRAAVNLGNGLLLAAGARGCSAYYFGRVLLWSSSWCSTCRGSVGVVRVLERSARPARARGPAQACGRRRGGRGRGGGLRRRAASCWPHAASTSVSAGRDDQRLVHDDSLMEV